MPFWRAQPVFQPSDKKGKVGALRTVEGVHLVDYKEAQRLGPVFLPKRLVSSPQEQVVEHLVVRQQDVRRISTTWRPAAL